MDVSKLSMIVIAAAIPAIGFIMTIRHARGADSLSDARWRKRHGMLFWVAIPAVAGGLTVLGLLEMAPSIASIVGVVLLLASATISMVLGRNR